MNLLQHPEPAYRAVSEPAGAAGEGAWPRRLLYALLALGVFFRLFHFFNNRSFFIDELFLNVSLLKFDFAQLATQPLDYQQKAPLGYLWVERLFVLLLGKHEPVLRLFSLLCGLGSLFVFVPVARYFLRGWGAVLAVGALALAYPAIYHSVEAKQYSAELFATILALWLYTRYHDATRPGPLLAWGVGGGLLLWFSFPTIFILVGTGAAAALPALRARDWPRLARYLLPGALWLLSFGLLYHFFVGKYHDSGWLAYFFQIKYDAYWPVRQPVAALKWLATKAYALLSHPLGLLLNLDNNRHYFGLKHVFKLGWLYLPLIGAGFYYKFRHQRAQFVLLALPVALTLLASALSQYPFYQRFTLFLAPLFLLALACGAQQLNARLLPGRRARYLLLALVLLPSLANSARQALDPDQFYNREYYRDVVFFVNDHYQPGDAVYVYWNMREAYDYYKPAYSLKYDAVLGSFVKNKSRSEADYLRHLQPDFAGFKGKKRLWFIYDVNNHDAIGDYVDHPAWYYAKAYPPGRLLNDYFATLGRRVAHYQRGNYAATLYELSR